MGNTRNIYADADAAINRLRNNGIFTLNKMIEIPKAKSVGIKLWGAIDYLKNYCGFSYYRLSR